LDVPDGEEDLIGRFLARYGEWAWDEVAFVASVLEAGARVLDVGAYLGTFGLGLGLRQNLASVCYVEVNPQIVPHLRENVRRLKRQPSQVVSALVRADTSRSAIGFTSAGNFGGLSFAAEAGGEPFTEAPESFTSLQELRQLYGPFDLVKLDVEGMEYELIRSDADYFKLGTCKLWLECNESPASLKIAELLLELQLDVFYFAFPSYNPNNLRNDPDPVFPFAYESGLLAGKGVDPSLDPTLQAHQCLLFPIHSVEDLRAAMWRTPRWGKKEWEAKSANEVAALAGRAMLGQDYERFLREGAPPAQWQDAQAFTNYLHDLEAQLGQQEELIAAERLAFQEFRDQAEQRAQELIRNADELERKLDRKIEEHAEEVRRLEAELRKQLDTGNALTEQVVELGNQLQRSKEALDAQGVQLEQVRAVASDRLFQLDLTRPRIRNAEEAAARAQARLLQSAREFGKEREELLAVTHTLREALDALEVQKEAAIEAQGHESSPSPSRDETDIPRSRSGVGRHVSRTQWYRESFRPRMKRLRRLFKKGKKA
jgi:FkbM family methyltransferase